MLGGSILTGMQSPALTEAPEDPNPLLLTLDHPLVIQGYGRYPTGRAVQTPKTAKPSVKHLIPHPYPKPEHGLLENLPEIKPPSPGSPPNFGGVVPFPRPKAGVRASGRDGFLRAQVSVVNM